MKLSSVIKLSDVKRSFTLGETTYDVLKGINLTIEKGDLVAIMGASGAGKSTLMNIIGLLDTLTHGTYLLEDQNVSTLSDDKRSVFRNKKIGFVFQSFYLLPRLTALSNVMLPLVYRGTKHQQAKQLAIDILEKVGMADLTQNKPNELSGGQQQRVAIARALVGKPSVLLADEPTGALDSKIGQEVMDLFISLNANEKVTTLMITHDPGIAHQCRRIIRIKDGLVVED